MEGSVNLGTLFFSWWYKEANSRFLAYIKKLFIYITDLFSVKICIKTLFAPWKRDMISYVNLSLQQKFQVFVLNLASRFVGAIIKISTLFTYLVVVSATFVFSIILTIIWFLYPILIIVLVVFGFRLVFL